MALVDTTWYCNFGNGTSTGYYAVTVRPQNTAVAAGVLRRQFTTPAVGSERVFVCIIAGTTANVTDATWVLTRGAKTTDGTATWMECTGQAGLNGDLTNTMTWAQVKAATPAVLGQVIKRSNNASYQICTTAGAMSASEPAFSDTAGTTTTDTTAVWTSLGPVANFTGGQAPFARIATACATNWFAAGNTVYVGDNHAESQGSALTIAPASSASTIGKILCHNQAAYPPASGNLTTGATVQTAGSFAMTINASVYAYGITFKVAVGSAAGGAGVFTIKTPHPGWAYWDNCSFWLATTASGASFQIGSSATEANTIIFDNTTMKFAHVNQFAGIYNCKFLWKNTGSVLASGSSIPTASGLLAATTIAGCFEATLEALDLSQITSVIMFGGTAFAGSVLIKDCKLNAAVAAPSLLTGSAGMTIQFVRCDSGATAYKSTRYAYEGTETTETTTTRVGGATDPAGQLQSRKIVTTANSQWLWPFKAQPYAIWNATTAANVTVTVYGTINSGTLPNNDEIWLEVEYLGSSSTPLGTIVNTTKTSLLASNAAVASDASTWNGGGSGAGWSPFKLTKTLSSPQPGQAGYIHVRVRAAKASATYYIDPQVYLS